MRTRYFHVDHALFLGIALALFCSAGFAQESRGSITGKVTDTQSGVVPNASVVVTNAATNVANRVSTNQTGYYEVNFLIPGTYTVAAEMKGFKKLVRTGI